MRCICIVLALFVSLNQMEAQNIEFGIGAGPILYSGDLDAPSLGKNISHNTRFHFGAFARFQLNGNFSMRLNYMSGKIVGADSISTRDWQINRNLDFQSKLNELSLLVEYSLFDITSEDATKRWTIYAATGIASLSHNPTTEFDNRIIELQPLGTEGQGLPGFAAPYSKRITTIPFVGGMKYKLNDFLTIQGELNVRYTLFDYLDDVSTSYVSSEVLIQNGSDAAALGNRTFDPRVDFSTGDQRGTQDVNDYYTTATLSFLFRFGDLGLGGNIGGAEGCPYNF